MNGQRKQKQPTAKQAIKRMLDAELQVLTAELEMERLNKNWAMKFDMVVKMFEAAIDEASTHGEVKRWYELWASEVNAIDGSADDAEQQMNDLLEKHGFQFTITPVAVSHQEMCGRKTN